jgi:hypothetical protein
MNVPLLSIGMSVGSRAPLFYIKGAGQIRTIMPDFAVCLQIRQWQLI